MSDAIDPDEFRRRTRALASMESRIETTIAVARSLGDDATLTACDEQMRRLDEQAMRLARRWHGLDEDT